MLSRCGTGIPACVLEAHLDAPSSVDHRYLSALSTAFEGVRATQTRQVARLS
jgi:hypothetical protein